MKDSQECVCPKCGGEAEYNGAGNQDRNRRAWTWNIFCFKCHLDKEAENHISEITVEESVSEIWRMVGGK